MDKPATESTSVFKKYPVDIQDENLREKIENGDCIMKLEPRNGNFYRTDAVFKVLLTDGGVVVHEIDNSTGKAAGPIMAQLDPTLAHPGGPVDIFSNRDDATKYVMLHQDFLKMAHIQSNILLAYGRHHLDNIIKETKRVATKRVMPRQGKLLRRRQKESSPSAAPEAGQSLQRETSPQSLGKTSPRSKETSPVKTSPRSSKTSPRSKRETSPRSKETSPVKTSPQSSKTSPRSKRETFSQVGESSPQSRLQIPTGQTLQVPLPTQSRETSPLPHLEPTFSRLGKTSSPQSLGETSPRSRETSPVKTSPRSRKTSPQSGETSPRSKRETFSQVGETSPQSRLQIPTGQTLQVPLPTQSRETSPQPHLEPTFSRLGKTSSPQSLRGGTSPRSRETSPVKTSPRSSRMKLPPIIPPPGVPEVTSVQFSSKPLLPNIPLSKPAGVDESDEDIAIARPPNRESPSKLTPAVQHEEQSPSVPTEQSSNDEPVDLKDIKVELQNM